MEQAKFLFALASLHFVFHQSLQLACQNVRHSLFYKPDMEAATRMTQARITYAERLLRRLAKESKVKRILGRADDYDGKNYGGANNGGSRNRSTDRRNRYCMGVVGTETRLCHRYLLQSVASLAGIGKVGADSRTDKFFVQVRAKVLPPGANADNEEQSINFSSHRDLKMIADAGIDVDFFWSPTHPFPDYSSRWLMNEARDYGKAIEKCLADSGADYVVIIEEDTFATKDFMDKLSDAVSTLQTKHEGEWTNLKLFVTDFWGNWERQTSDYITLGIGGVLFAFVCECLMILGKNCICVRWLRGQEQPGNKRGAMRRLGDDWASHWARHWARRSPRPCAG